MKTTVDRIIELMQKNDITAKSLTEKLDMSCTAITDWKKGKAQPSIDALKKIATYFNVSIDFLVYGELSNSTSISDVISDDEMILINKYRSLGEISREKTQAYIDGMLAHTNNRTYI